MKLKHKLLCVALFLGATLFVFGCGTDNKLTKPNDEGEGDSSNCLKIITWNVKEFPCNDNTLTLMAEIIKEKKPDVIGLQELYHTSDFEELGELLIDYDEYYTETSPNGDYYNPPVGYLVNNKTVSVNAPFMKIYQNDYLPFPRDPFVARLSWKGNSFVIINLHLKAGGDNVINYNNHRDEEYRRLQANELIDTYIKNNLSTEKVIVLGDFNDQIHEPIETNVFTPFQNEDYIFADMPLTDDVANYSYPHWPSHLDHFILTDEFSSTTYSCETLSLDKQYISYFSEISDHRPVQIKIDFEVQK